MGKKYTTKNWLSKVNEAAISYKTDSYDFSIASILGLEASYINEPLHRVKAFRMGFSKSTFESLKSASGLDNNTLALALGVSAKTLQRAHTFDVVQSEKMYELATLYAVGLSYFGKDGFKRWMERPLFSIGNIIPLSLLDVSEGIDLLKTEILRMQHGIAV